MKLLLTLGVLQLKEAVCCEESAVREHKESFERTKRERERERERRGVTRQRVFSNS